MALDLLRRREVPDPSLSILCATLVLAGVYMRRPAQIRISFDNTSANRSPPHDDRSCGRQSAHGVGPYEHAEPAPRRKALPEHLPREDRRIDLDSPVCSCCGGELHAIGASISEMLDWIPAQVRVLRIRRPSTGNRRSLRAMALTWNVLRWPVGWAGRVGGSMRCMSTCAPRSLPRIICSPTTHRSRSWIRGAAKPRPGVCG